MGKAAAMDLAKEGVHLAICSRKIKSIERAKEEILGVVKDAKNLSLQGESGFRGRNQNIL